MDDERSLEERSAYLMDVALELGRHAFESAMLGGFYDKTAPLDGYALTQRELDWRKFRAVLPPDKRRGMGSLFRQRWEEGYRRS